MSSDVIQSHNEREAENMAALTKKAVSIVQLMDEPKRKSLLILKIAELLVSDLFVS